MNKFAGCPPESQPTVLLKVLRGSKAYGLELDASDTDTSVVYIQPTRSLLSLRNPSKPTKPSKDEAEDSMSWEVGHFLRLASNCNPSVLEAFLAPVMEGLEEAEGLRKLFPHVLRKSRVYDLSLGLTEQNRKKALNEKLEYKRRKAGANMLRLLYNGIELLKEGTFTVRIADTAIGSTVMAAKVGDLSQEEVFQRVAELESELSLAYSKSKLQENCNYAVLDNFLLGLRSKYW